MKSKCKEVTFDAEDRAKYLKGKSKTHQEKLKIAKKRKQKKVKAEKRERRREKRNSEPKREEKPQLVEEVMTEADFEDKDVLTEESVFIHVKK